MRFANFLWWRQLLNHCLWPCPRQNSVHVQLFIPHSMEFRLSECTISLHWYPTISPSSLQVNLSSKFLLHRRYPGTNDSVQFGEMANLNVKISPILSELFPIPQSILTLEWYVRGSYLCAKTGRFRSRRT